MTSLEEFAVPATCSTTRHVSVAMYRSRLTANYVILHYDQAINVRHFTVDQSILLCAAYDDLLVLAYARRAAAVNKYSGCTRHD